MTLESPLLAVASCVGGGRPGSSDALGHFSSLATVLVECGSDAYGSGPSYGCLVLVLPSLRWRSVCKVIRQCYSHGCVRGWRAYGLLLVGVDPQLATYTYTPSPPGSFTNCMLHHLWAGVASTGRTKHAALRHKVALGVVWRGSRFTSICTARIGLWSGERVHLQPS